MRRFFLRCSLAAVAAAALSTAVINAAEINPDVDQFFKDYIAAFAAGDAEKLAGLWTTDAAWTNTNSGERSTGRDAVQADFAAFFAENPGARLTGDVQHAKQLAEGVMCIEGTAAVAVPGQPPAPSIFSAVLVQQDGKWLLADVRESAPPAAESPAERLKSLEPLIGNWQDEGGDVQVNTSFRWAADGAFLVRTYEVTRDDATLRGTQVIGWDPRENRLRSWNFVSDGSFGQGHWSQSGDEWVGQLSQTLVDGGAASATQVIRWVDDDTLEVETVGRQVDGEPQPSTPPVRMVRVEGAATDAASDAGQQTTTDAAAAAGGEQ
ncbi:MAG: DUF4440 domain-containing protein [Planctomycetaceae bacterium]|nr:DUF4440 domain-containing protein [Planctomycetaceae bacterium]